MKQALGLVEIEGLCAAVLVADTMIKAADVELLEIEDTKGQGYITVKVIGDADAVNAAVTAGKQIGMVNQKLISPKVIPWPAADVAGIFADPESPGLATPADQEPPETEKIVGDKAHEK